jgi:hypothetical protein
MTGLWLPYMLKLEFIFFSDKYVFVVFCFRVFLFFNKKISHVFLPDVSKKREIQDKESFFFYLAFQISHVFLPDISSLCGLMIMLTYN